MEQDREKLNANLKDLETQNKLLHDHLETTASKLTALQRERLPSMSTAAEVGLDMTVLTSLLLPRAEETVKSRKQS